MKLNNKNCQLSFKRLQEMVKDEYPELDLNQPYLDKLCHQTKSPRIINLIRQAYYLGMARGIKRVDEGMTPVVLDPIEMINHSDALHTL